MQNNGCIKSDGVGLTDNPSALWQWIVAGPEAAALIEDFETRKCVQEASRKDVCSLVNVMEELGHPFEESEGLLFLDNKEIADPLTVETVKKAQKID